MSKMSNLWTTIEELVAQGVDAQSIADKLNIPVEWVYVIEDQLDAEFAN